MELLSRLESIAAADPDRPAYAEAHGRWSLSYAQLARQVHAVRTRVASAVAPGDLVVLHLSNVIEFPSWFLGLITAGVNVLTANAGLTPFEVDAFASRADARLIVSHTGNACSGRIGWAASLEPASMQPSSPSAPSPGSLLLASSGSTGVPKIARRSAASLDAVARNVVEAIGFESPDRVLAAVPLSHSYGIEHGLLAPLWAGSSVVLCEGLDLTAMRLAFAQGITLYPAVPSMIERLADLSDTIVGLSALRRIYSAGGPLPDAVRDRFSSRYGLTVGQLYGATEIGSVTYRALDATDPRSVGSPMRDVSVRCLDLDHPGTFTPGGVSGEIAIRSPSMMDAYLDGPAPLVDGHFLTGDLGHTDANGHLIITGRTRLLIDTGGLKVNPFEVEQVLETHPGVAACVVLPIRQSETVCRLRAVVVAREDHAPPTADDLRAFARTCLAAHKVPRVIEFRSELPRSATGKVLRHMLEQS